MSVYYQHDRAALFCGDSASLLKLLPAECIDSLITDPPSGIGFMGADWDSDKGGRDQWIEWLAGVLRECYRVMKPGAHGLVWALPRTSHWTALAIEAAGFEIRDRVSHFFGSGFPKSMNVSKSLAKKGSPEAEQWDGFGTALKPACEDWWIIRKPIKGTIVANVLKHGTGALNIGACRVGSEVRINNAGELGVTTYGKMARNDSYTVAEGRWPAHVILDEEAGAVLDAQAGPSKSTKGKPRKGKAGDGYGMTHTGAEYTDSGGPSRFFYCPKPARKEKEAGLEAAGIQPKSAGEATKRKDGSAGLDNPRAGAGRTGGARNSHPTVKATTLMRWLIRLITPPGGTVLDPFTGSGTTAVAALEENESFIGCELSPEFAAIATARIRHTLKGTVEDE